MKLSGEYEDFNKGLSAGFDKKTGRYRDIDGNRISKAKYLETKLQDSSPELHMINSKLFSAPVSRDFEQLENIIGSSKPILDTNRPFKEFAEKPSKAWPMPQDILTAMRLSEYFYRTEGDVAYALQVPREVLFAQEFEIKSPSKEIQKDLEELYDQDQLDMIQLMKEIDDCESVYANTFPLILPSGNNDSPMAGVTLLNPKYVYVGTPVASEHISSSTGTVSTESFTSTFGLLSQSETAWNKALLKNEIHPLAYNSFGPRWNEQDVSGLWIDLNPKYLKPVQVNKQRWERYATPYLSRAFRAITNRKVFEELRRATAEGYKSQLFLFNVGTPEVPGTIEELRIYSSILNSLAPERTGMILGRGNIKGEVLHMDALEGMLAESTWHGLTLAIFRNLGINMRFVSGEHPSQGRGPDDLDIMLFSERMTFKQKMLSRWERWFRLTLAELTHPNDSKYMEDMRKTTVQFQKPMIEMATYIKSVLMPLFTIGAMSIQTLHEKAQLNHEAEVKNRKTEVSGGEDILFGPRTTYVQQTVNPDGDKKTTSQPEPSVDIRQNQAIASVEHDNMLEEAIKELRESKQLLQVITAMEQSGNKFPSTLTLDLQGLKLGDTIIQPPNNTVIIPEQPAPVINMEAAKPPEANVFNIHMPEQPPAPPAVVNVLPAEQKAPIVNVEAVSSPPSINVTASPAKVDVIVPEQKQPNITVKIPRVKRKRTKVERDSSGDMTGSTEDVEYEE